jgi:hypothetical protein
LNPVKNISRIFSEELKVFKQMEFRALPLPIIRVYLYIFFKIT